jgi:hypothetical protein
VFEGPEVVQESAETNMLDYLGGALYCDLHGFPEAGLWVDEHRHEYFEGLFRGFVTAE